MPAIYSPETLSKMAIWRAKAVDGTLTQEEMKEAVLTMRADRKAAATSADSSARRAKVKAAIPSADDMLSELG